MLPGAGFYSRCKGGVRERFEEERGVVRLVAKEDKSGGSVQDGLERLSSLEVGRPGGDCPRSACS